MSSSRAAWPGLGKKTSSYSYARLWSRSTGVPLGDGDGPVTRRFMIDSSTIVIYVDPTSRGGHMDWIGFDLIQVPARTVGTRACQRGFEQ